MVFIVGIMVIMVIDVASRALLGRAVTGTAEWAQVLLVCCMISLGPSILSDRQIKIDILTKRLSPRGQVALDIIILLLTFLTISIIAWRQFAFCLKSAAQKDMFHTIGIPLYPFIAVFGIGYALGALSTLAVVIRKVTSFFKGKEMCEYETILGDGDEEFVSVRRDSK
jgi:TRAP-type C4-dicarboxylate transport system permease small subunit